MTLKNGRFFFLSLFSLFLAACFEVEDTRDGVSGLDHRVFVTKDTFSANFDGSSPDSICLQAAEAAKLERNYKAIISYSSSSGHARTRLGDGSGFIYKIDSSNTLFQVDKSYSDVDGLWDGSLLSPINLDEYGNAVSGSDYVFTASSKNGLKFGTTAADFCNNWTSVTAHAVRMGNLTQTDARWIDDIAGDCSSAAHLYCISE